MTTYVSEENDKNQTQEFIKAFCVEFQKRYNNIAELLLLLEKQPKDKEICIQLKNIVTAINNDCVGADLTDATRLSHAVKKLFDYLVDDKLRFSNQISDVVLLALDHVSALSEAQFSGEEIVIEEAVDIEKTILELCQNNDLDIPPPLAEVIEKYDRQHGITIDTGPKTHLDDIDFFHSLVKLVESRSSYWTGRSQRILNTALDMNKEAGEPVNPAQLRVAVLMHDIGMAFLPLDIIHKPSTLDPSERKKVEVHPQLGAQLLSRMSGFDDSAKMVEQHHERIDGQGYPFGLKGEEICEGARILAIADTFDAMTSERPERTYKRSFLRALAEINNFSGSQFCPKWVEVLNRVARKYFYIRVARGA